MATPIIISYILHAFAAILFATGSAIFYYKAGDDCWDRGGWIFIGVLCNIVAIVFFCTLTWRLTCNTYGI